jgi:hypothetical protein
LVPAVEIVKNVNDLAQVTKNATDGNLNANVKEAFASALGMMAAFASALHGPAAALAADQLMSDRFKEAYDLASRWSANQDWSPLFDFIEGTITGGSIPASPAAFDPNLYHIPGLPSVLDPICNTNFLAAKNWVPPRDPLVLDLDGDGIETVGINPKAAILFDHNADGVKTATGWIKADDGLLVLDRDGNGQIDTGRELFGDATVLAHGPRAGQQAQDGYEALADQDSNADRVLDSTDAAWGQLRVWRDLNQDGISQAGKQSRNAQWPRVSGCGRKYKRNRALALDRIDSSATEFNRSSMQGLLGCGSKHQCRTSFFNPIFNLLN